MSVLSLERINAQLDKALHRIKRKVEKCTPRVEMDDVTRFTSGTTITGLLTCSDNCYFDGTLNGTLNVKNKLVLGKNSEVFGGISAGDLLAKGKINGPVKVNNKTVYCSTSTIIGSCFETNFLVVEQGAVLNLGSMSMQDIGAPVCISTEPTALPQTAIKKKKAVADATLTVKPEVAVRAEPDSIPEFNQNDDLLLSQFFQSKDNNIK
jgi:cytoskeletal protein CcmA (bactofilin family)